ncbi:MAG: glutamyl-tRNA synthetase [Parcubacteria group bacterium LiPW_30]|nr:MAG: glutamyl-tRNA synthetase [Parcubacteria group bacterium LiPW_30]
MNSPVKQIRVRIAPSPTGSLHIGTARTALFNYIFAKQQSGVFIIRIEDTDKERSKKEFEDNILDGLSWLKIKPDEFYRQSERTEIYKKYIEKLIADGSAYISKEEAGEGKRSEVIRFKNPNKAVTFNDIIRGPITFETKDLGDFVIAKDLDTPLYHLAVVVDDHEMKISHVIRGEDHISNTPRQIMLLEAIGANIPTYAHLPLILAPDKSKLSKRHGAIAVTEYRENGFLPEAIVNFLAILGWSPQSRGEEENVLSFEDVVEKFELEKVSKSGAVFDIKKLEWINKQYIKKIPQEDLREIIREKILTWGLSISNEEMFVRSIPLITEKISTLNEASAVWQEELLFLEKSPKYDVEKLIWKDEGVFKTKENLSKILEIIQMIDSSEFSAERIKELIFPFADSVGRGGVLWPMRFSLTGQEKSPDPFMSAYLLGKDESILRISQAVNLLK